MRTLRHVPQARRVGGHGLFRDQQLANAQERRTDLVRDQVGRRRERCVARIGGEVGERRGALPERSDEHVVARIRFEKAVDPLDGRQQDEFGRECALCRAHLGDGDALIEHGCELPQTL